MIKLLQEKIIGINKGKIPTKWNSIKSIIQIEKDKMLIRRTMSKVQSGYTNQKLTNDRTTRIP